MHSDFINSEAVAVQVEKIGFRRLTHWPSKRVTHSLENSKKLSNAFTRCGSENNSYLGISTLSEDICEASDEILSAFSQWAETHLSTCKNNQVHIERFNTKWSKIYSKVLGCDENQSTTPPTTQSISVTNPIPHRFCESFNAWTTDCSQCYSYKYSDDSFWSDEIYDYYNEDFTCEFSISTVCDPNFRDKLGHNCQWYSMECKFIDIKSLIMAGVMSEEGYMTGLNCPACGCGEDGPIHLDSDVPRL